MAAVEITCPHCNRRQKVAEHRLTETVYCLMCQQLITDVYLHKVEPKQQELNIKLKGRLVSEFGTTKLEELKSKSDDYTGRFEPVEEKEDSTQVRAIEETTIRFESGTYNALPPSHRKLSTAARTYLIGGVVMALLTTAAMITGVMLLDDTQVKKDEIETIGAEGERIERWPSGAVKAQWHAITVDGQEVPDGAWREWHEAGEDKTAGQYQAGKKVGAWRGWHVNHQLAFEGNYTDGKQTGTWTEWHANGRKASEGAYVAGQKHGEWRTWHATGGFESSSRFEHSQPVGAWVSWFEDGRVRNSGEYEDGRKVGRWIVYHDNGIEELSEYWEKGVLQGETYGNFRNRQQSFKGQWSNGLRNGEWIWWHTTGVQAKRGSYQDGLEQGEWTEWYDIDVLRLKGEYNKGMRVGEWQEFDEDGNLSARRTYKEGMLTRETFFFRSVQVQHRQEQYPDGSLSMEWTVTVADDGTEILHGYQRSYYRNGRLAELGAYVRGEKDGPWSTWDEVGNLLTKEVFQQGKKVQ